MADDDQWQRVKTRFISDLGHFFETYGGSEILGWIMGLLTFTADPLPLPEIAQELRISKAAASIHLRTLRQIGLVEKVSTPGDRRDFYLLHRDFEQGMLAGTLKKVQDGIFIWEKTVSALKELPEDGIKAKKRFALVGGRIDSLLQLYASVQQAVADLCRQRAREKVHEVLKEREEFDRC